MPEGGIRVTPEMEQLMLDLYKRGYSMKKIAEMLGISPSTVSRHLRKLLKRREGGEAEPQQQQEEEQQRGEPSGGGVQGSGVESAGGPGEHEQLGVEVAVDSMVDVKPVKYVLDELESIRLEVEAVGRKIYLDPVVLLYYAYARKRGYKGTLSDFITDCVIDAMEARGIHIAIVEKVVRHG